MTDEKIYYRTVIEIYTDIDPSEMTDLDLIVTGFISRDATEEYYLNDLPYPVQRYFQEP